MLSTHPKVGMTVLVGVRVKAKVRALARRDAHSFLAVRAVCCIVALCCCNLLFSLESGREGLGMAVLVGVRVKAKVWALTRRDAHPFLAVWAIFGIIALRCGNRCCDFFYSTSSRRAVYDRLRSGLSLF